MATIQERILTKEAQEKTFTDRLTEKREQAQRFNVEAQSRFAGALDPSQEGPLVDPAAAFRSLQSFQTGAAGFLEPSEAALTTTSSALDALVREQAQVEATKAQAAEGPKAPTIGELLAADKAGMTIERDVDNNLILVSKAAEDQGSEKVLKIITELEQLNTEAITGKLRKGVGFLGFGIDEANQAQGLLNQLVAELQLDAAGRLKGQGTLTDSERKLLKDSIGAFNIDDDGRVRVTDKVFRIELKKLKDKFGGEAEGPAGITEADLTFNPVNLLDEIGF